jgi:hypothetical protein
MLVNAQHLDAETRARLEAESRERKARGTSGKLAAAMASPWEPWTVAQAFATPVAGMPVFTMQVWIDLAAVRSPLLSGGELDHDQVLAAFLAFGLRMEEFTGEQAAVAVVKMRLAIAEGWAAAIPMRPPKSVPQRPDGFGTWAPLLACLVAECGLSDERALAMKVSAMHVLVASHRRNQGWEEGGVPYALRDIQTEEAA